jgi:hypothetical protein
MGMRTFSNSAEALLLACARQLDQWVPPARVEELEVQPVFFSSPD